MNGLGDDQLVNHQVDRIHNPQLNYIKLHKKVNTIKQNLLQTEQDLANLMPSLLDKAFKGEL